MKLNNDQFGLVMSQIPTGFSVVGYVNLTGETVTTHDYAEIERAICRYNCRLLVSIDASIVLGE